MRRGAAHGVLSAGLALALAPASGAQAPPAAPPAGGPISSGPVSAGPVEPLPVELPGDAAGHFRLGLRTGYGLPLGRYAEVRNFAGFRDDDVNAISDDTHGVIPLWLDAGYWLTSHVYLGAYFAFGIVLPKVAPSDNPLSGGCPEDVDCAASGVRAGIAAEYAFGPFGATRPWVGLGLGYEWVDSTIDYRTLDFRLQSLQHGFELLQLSGGADFHLSPGLGLGPFVTLSALQYTSCSLDFRGEQVCEIEDAAWHGWLLLGVRGALTL